MRHLFNWQPLYYSIFILLVAGCQNSARKVLQDSVTTVDTVTHTEVKQDNGGLMTIPEDSLDKFIYRTYKFDSAFGTKWKAVLNKSTDQQDNYETVTYQYTFGEHRLEVKSTRFFRESTSIPDSTFTSYYFDGKKFDTTRIDEGNFTTAGIDLDLSDEIVYQYTTDKNYYVIEGSPIDAVGKFARIAYALVFDVNKKQVYLASTYYDPGEFYFKNDKGVLTYLFYYPADREDGEEKKYEIKVDSLIF
ncbi:hypothetical protein DVR12_17830 [Chitinophaga silvatica]|uniref:Uncharacterized protein n=1 Tax=Chitinophaga silvatica TaxID=2282649 RepID=A0A3E1Y7Z6_9BACT|nr:hypothetical protein [Chitinophaga silvatica]RFS21194.1 hypothetical protein DVR12_17830 [Chitinophaga silvatica]